MSDTRQCPQCGTPNDVGLSLCTNCKFPLTKYAADLQGEAYQGKLAAQAAAASQRPPVVTVITVLLVLIGLWVLRYDFSLFANRPKAGEDDTGYAFAALGVIGPIFMSFLLVPLAVSLMVLSGFTYLQNGWTWNVNVGVWIALGIFALANLHRHPFVTILAVLAIVVLMLFWCQPRTKAWYALL